MASSGGSGFELLSGPDLGGGYLHQLTVERFSGVNRFLYHAQDGGPDANGPPIGTLAPFGWQVSPSMCPIGGRQCWHRAFTLPIEESLKVRTAYNRTRFVMEAMLGHEYRGVPTPVDAAVVELDERLRAAPEPIPWFVGGSLGLYLRGAPVTPRDGDLGTTPEAVSRIAEALKDYVTEPAAPTAWGETRMLAARAFVGTVRNGLRVEWGFPLDAVPDSTTSEWTALVHGSVPDQVEWKGRTLPVGRPEFTLVRWALAERHDRLATLAPWLPTAGIDRRLLRTLAEGSGLPEAARNALVARI
ncbi:MAG: hypothetical protein L3K00_05770 [Thermoplasmata archaeon]|nr:hypothetical protein [Thermoplasmata archaeon]